MGKWETATRVISALGFGGGSVNTLACRTLQQVGPSCCTGHIARVGSGAYRVGNALCSAANRGPPSITYLLKLYDVLLPTLRWLVAGALGPSWCGLITFQTFQSLLCETRKWEDETRERRPDSDERRKHYEDVLGLVLAAMGIKVDEFCG